MNISRKKNSFGVCFWSVLLAVGLLMSVLPGTVAAKSLYVNKNLNANSPISAYDIQPAPSYLAHQQTSSPTRYGGAGLAIDTDSEILFVTFETSGKLDIVDAKTLAILGQVTAPGASNLAGIVVDQGKQKLYTVQRNSGTLYVYDWNAVAKTLTLETTQGLTGVSAAHGIALDEVNGLLYVGDMTKTVKIFNTAGWSSAGSFSVSQAVQGIAVDVSGGFVYTGNSYEYYGSSGLLCKYDLNTNTETTTNIRTITGSSSDNVVGLAVDPATSLLYITTGNQGSGGSDCIMVFDSSLTFLYRTGDIGDPTGLVVPGKDISYNPLNLSKEDGLDDKNPDDCVPVGGTIIYDICYDNTLNLGNVTEVTMVDKLPPEVIFVSATGGGIYNPGAHTVTWDIGSLPAGDAGACVQLVVQVELGTTPGSILVNACTINGAEPGTGPTTIHEPTDVCLNQPPDCDDAYADPGCLWSPNNKLVAVEILGVTDPDGDPVYITITGITSDEPTASDEGAGGAKHAPDAAGVGEDIAQVRSERSGLGNGRVYEISFTASDGMGGECEGSVTVCVPHDQGGEDCECIDDGQIYDATQIN